MSIVNDRLRQIKRERKLTLQEMADQAGLKSVTLANYLKGREPKLDAITKLSDAFGVSLEWLLGKTDDPTPIGNISLLSASLIEKQLYESREPMQMKIMDKLDELKKYISIMYKMGDENNAIVSPEIFQLFDHLSLYFKNIVKVTDPMEDSFRSIIQLCSQMSSTPAKVQTDFTEMTPNILSFLTTVTPKESLAHMMIESIFISSLMENKMSVDVKKLLEIANDYQNSHTSDKPDKQS